ncbi:MAG: hypothetical protein M3O86_01860 [Actinomycetota bacterium]|nr:hypothetical protein [Actinomycetota bacterium]
MTVAALAEHLRDADSAEVRWRLVREFLEEFRHEDRASQQRLIADEPPPVAARWDALLAALAEHLAFHRRLRCPPGHSKGSGSCPRHGFSASCPPPGQPPLRPVRRRSVGG